MDQERMRALEKTIDSDYGNTAGIVVQENGIKRYEKYFGTYAAGDAVHVASVTKSVVSALMGIALEKGYIKSVDQKVLDFFPDYKVLPDEHTKQDITLAHLLTMTAPFSFKGQIEPYEAFFVSDNWVKAALDLLGGEEPVGTFRYSPIIGAHILAGVLVQATGQSILDFATENLFSPLGIRVANVTFHSPEEQIAWFKKDRYLNGWVVDPQGINSASWGLTLTPLDMVKIGQLYLNSGAWEGRQVVPAAWIDTSTRTHARDGALAYGYLWWIIDEKEHAYAAMGDGGNVIYVNEKKNMVVSIASYFVPNARDRIGLIRKHIEPLLEEGV